MRVVFYTHPFFLEPALHFVREMSSRVDVHLMLELTPRSLGSLLATTPAGLPEGIIAGDRALAERFPPRVRAYWAGARSFDLVVYGNRRTLDPRTVPTSVRSARAIDAFSPDVVHLDDASLRLAMARPWLPPITLMNVHDPVPHSGDRNRHIEVARRLLRPRVRRHRVHAEVFRMPYAAAAGVAPSRVDVVPLGVYSILREWTTATTARDDRTVAFVGRLAPYKGLDDLYAAAPLVAARVPGVRFVVAGRPVAGYAPPDPPLLSRGGVVDTHYAHVETRNLAEILQSAALVVCPYRDATQSGVILSAYGSGAPVVATATGGLPEYVDHEVTGLLVPPTDPHALAEAIIRILLDRRLRNQLAEGVQEASRNRLSWSTIVDGVLASYASTSG